MKGIFNDRTFSGNMTYQKTKSSIILNFRNNGKKYISLSLIELKIMSIPVYFFDEYTDRIEFYIWDSPMLGKCIFKRNKDFFSLFFYDVYAVREQMVPLEEKPKDTVISQEMFCGEIKPFQSYREILAKKIYTCSMISQIKYKYVFKHDEYEEFNKIFNEKCLSGASGDFDKSLRIMRMLHKITISAGQTAYVPKKRSGITLLKARRDEKIQLNCRGCAIILNDALLAMGIPAKFITCMSDNPYDPECHVTNSVFIKEYNKWIMLDAATQSYVEGKDGLPLSLYEVHNKLISGERLKFMVAPNILNTNLMKHNFERYLIKNMYCFLSYEEYGPYCDNWNNRNQKYLLLPNNSDSCYLKANLEYTNTFITNNPLIFFS